MTRLGAAMVLVLGIAALGAAMALVWQQHEQAKPAPSTATIVSQVQEVARLQTLEMSLHKKISFEPSPEQGDSAWQDVWHWAAQALRPARGRVIVFAVAHLGLDIARLGANSLRADGRSVFIVLPPLQVDVELQPGETEVIGSNLDSAQTTQLLESAKQAFVREVQADRTLQTRARGAAERALTGLLLGLGFERVQFVGALPDAEGAPAG